MSHAEHSNNNHTEHPEDAMAGLVHSIPVVLPLVGAALIFLLAFIAVSVA